MMFNLEQKKYFTYKKNSSEPFFGPPKNLEKNCLIISVFKKITDILKRFYSVKVTRYFLWWLGEEYHMVHLELYQ